MKPIFAPMARPAIMVPSITACGSCRKITWSLQVPGSLSSPLTRTYFGLSDCLGTNDHFMPGGKARAAAPAQPGGLHLVDDPLGPFFNGVAHGLVAVQLEVLVDLRRALPKAARDDLYFIGMGNESRHRYTVSFPRPAL